MQNFITFEELKVLFKNHLASSMKTGATWTLTWIWSTHEDWRHLKPWMASNTKTAVTWTWTWISTYMTPGLFKDHQYFHSEIISN